MAWTASNLSGAGVSALIGGSFYGSGQTFAGDTVKAALYGTTPTPNKDDTLAHNAYNGAAGPWVLANESTGSGYSAGGTALGTKTNAEASGVVTVDAADTAWATVTLSNVYGCLVYDSTVTNAYAYCWNYFGGPAGVSGGSFTIVWNTSGIFTITIS